jgi:flagellar hook-basal body complex protein FliE
MSGIAPISAITSITGLPGVSGVSGMGSIGSMSGTSSIAGTTSIGGSSSIDGTAVGTQPAGDSFLNSLSDAFGSLNGQLTSADTSMADFASGGSADLHTVMLQMEEASVSLKAATTVRDKLLEAYTEIMRTQL